MESEPANYSDDDPRFRNVPMKGPDANEQNKGTQPMTSESPTIPMRQRVARKSQI
jgi:hypothetical protein